MEMIEARNKDGQYTDSPEDKYHVAQITDIFLDYFKSVGIERPPIEEFENMLFKDKNFHHWLKETHGYTLLYRPIDRNWIMEMPDNK